MRRYISLVACSLAIALMISGCKKEDDNNPADNFTGNSNINMSATVDGSSWSAVGAITTYDPIVNTLKIEAMGSEGKRIILYYEGIEAPEDYELSANSVSSIEFRDVEGNTYTSGSAPGGAMAGSLVLSTFNLNQGTASGQFETNVFSPGSAFISIASGSFNVSGFVNIADDGDDDDDGGGESMMTWDINGETHSTQNITNFEVSTENRISVTMRDSEFNGVKIRFNPDVSPGTYEFDSDEIDILTCTVNLILYHTQTGMIVVSENNTSLKQITGTFEFEAEISGGSEEIATIENGEFTINYAE